MGIYNIFSISQNATHRGNLMNAVGSDGDNLNSWLHLACTETESIVPFLCGKLQRVLFC